MQLALFCYKHRAVRKAIHMHFLIHADESLRAKHGSSFIFPGTRVSFKDLEEKSGNKNIVKAQWDE